MNKKHLFVLPLISLISIGCSKSEITNVEFELTDFTSAVEIHNDDVLNTFINNIEETIADVNLYYVTDEINSRLYKGEDVTLNKPVELSWKAKATGGSISSYKVLISEGEDLSNPLIYKTNKPGFEFYNAKVDTQYYWAVQVGKFVSDIHTFSTNENVIRTVKVDGITNVRDLGGYHTIKQGLLYRGSAFENFNETYDRVEIEITKKGQDTLTKELGIKTEIDIRRDKDSENCGLSKSTVNGLKYVALPMEYHGQNILTYKNSDYDNPARIKDFFELLAEPTNYPVYLHCSHGKDRTGCLSYLLEALTGLDDTYLYTDYLLSNFGIPNANMKSGGISGYYGKTLSNYQEAGWTYAETVYHYLNEVVGISITTLDSVLDIIKA